MTDKQTDRFQSSASGAETEQVRAALADKIDQSASFGYLPCRSDHWVDFTSDETDTILAALRIAMGGVV